MKPQAGLGFSPGMPAPTPRPGSLQAPTALLHDPLGLTDGGSLRENPAESCFPRQRLSPDAPMCMVQAE